MDTWSFHAKCGSNIKFVTAEVKDRTERINRVVISSEPISPDTLYEIQVEENVRGHNQECTAFGVCTSNPSTLQDLSRSNNIDTFVGVNTLGVCVTSPRGPAHQIPGLDVYTINSSRRLGVMVKTYSESRSLHLYLDGKDKGPVAQITGDKCWAVFDLNTSLKVNTRQVNTWHKMDAKHYCD